VLHIDQTTDSTGLGVIVRAGDADWDQVRQTFNLLVDQQPVAVALPTSEREVAAVVQWAREHGYQVAAQATGHNAAPLGRLADTVVLNTSRLTGVRIDAANRRVRVGAATKWEAVVPELSELGLAALHGSSPDVGIVGYSLGGGMGWLARRHGLQCNSVTAIELVTSDGDLTQVDAVHEPELFWALRGGGGNFGIVTAIEFEVFPVTEVYAGALFFPYARAGEVLRAWRDLLPSLPDEMTSWATLMHFPDVPFVPEPLRGQSFAIVLGAFLGDESEGRRVLAGLRGLDPVMDTFAMGPPAMLGELAMDPPEPLPYLTAHQSVDGLSDHTIDELIAALAPDRGITVLQLRHGGGELGRARDGAGARATLNGEIVTFAVGVVTDWAAGEFVRSSLDAVESILAPHAVGAYASFVEAPSDARRFYDGPTWERLGAVKALYDPGDVFRGNHHIPPRS
jgi:FAD/FMN-containing dehydrogenase